MDAASQRQRIVTLIKQIVLRRVTVNVP